MAESNTQKVLSNTFYQVVGRFVSAVETLVATALVTRTLGPAGYGDIIIVITYVSTFFVMADFGINNIVVRSWAKEPQKAKAEFTDLLVLRFIMSLALCLAAAVLAVLLSKTSAQYSQVVLKGIMVGLTLIIGQSLYFSASAVFQTFFSYAKSFWASLWGNIVALILLVVAIYFGVGELGVIGAIILGSLVPTVLALYFVREYLSLKSLRFNFKYSKLLLVASLPTGLGLIINTVYTSSDRLLLSVLVPASALGLYGLAYKVFENILVLPNFYMNASFPVMVARKEESQESLGHTVQKIFDAISLVVFPLIAGGIILSPVIINLVGGESFSGADTVLAVLFLGSVIYFYSPLFRWLLIVEHQEWWLPWIYGLGLATNVALNLIAIPRYGIVGAAVVNAISELAVLVFSAVIVHQSLRLRLKLRTFVMAIISTLVMVPFVLLFRDWWLVGPTVLGGIVYVLVLYILRVDLISPAEKLVFKQK